MGKINRCWIDLDENLIHTMLRDPEQKHFRFGLNGDDCTYYTVVRPCAQSIIDYCRELVGVENTHILTAATRDYAEKINELAGWGFKNEDIFAREDLKAHSIDVKTAYGGRHTQYGAHKYAHPDNVIIDDLPFSSNINKTHFIGIERKPENYLQTDEYYGVNNFDSEFKKSVFEFLNSFPKSEKR